MKIKKRKKTMTVMLVRTFIFTIFVVAILAAITVTFITRYIDSEISKGTGAESLNSITIEQELENIFGVIGTRMIFLVGFSVIVGVTMFAVTGRRIIKPIKKISDATKKVSEGNFDVELKKYRDDEIGELTDQFNQMVKELKKVEYLRKDFISNVSHEFKTPITAIDGYVQLLDDDNLSNEERKEYINIIKEETKRLTNLTANTLRLSKLENQEEQQNVEEYLLDEQIRKCILFLEKTWETKNINFNLKLEQVKIYAEKELVEQVWINIISNAIKFSNEGGTITILLKKEKDVAIVRIKDEGIGIEKEKLDRIFEKFYQADKSHSQKGSGLGLAITRRIINLCEGQIEVESEVGKGTEFIIELPIKLVK